MKLTNDKANYFDIADGWVYRGNASDDLTMYKMRTDGSERTLLSSDKGMFLSMAGDWIYYVSFQDKSKRDTTRIRADGTGKAVVQ